MAEEHDDPENIVDIEEQKTAKEFLTSGEDVESRRNDTQGGTELPVVTFSSSELTEASSNDNAMKPKEEDAPGKFTIAESNTKVGGKELVEETSSSPKRAFVTERDPSKTIFARKGENARQKKVCFDTNCNKGVEEDEDVDEEEMEDQFDSFNNELPGKRQIRTTSFNEPSESGGGGGEDSSASAGTSTTFSTMDIRVQESPIIPRSMIRSSGVDFEAIAELRSSAKNRGRNFSNLSPNRPHPSLDVPALYWFLKAAPFLFEPIKKLYAFRWHMAYPLQRRVLFSRRLSKLGFHCTIGEMLLLLPFHAIVVCAIIYTFVDPDISLSGRAARGGLMGALIFAQKHSFVTLLLGMPFDRALLYHKLAGYEAFCGGLLHTMVFLFDGLPFSTTEVRRFPDWFDGSVQTSGTLLMFFFTCLMVTSIQWIRNRMFEVFYVCHILFVSGMAVCAFFHSGKLIPFLAGLTVGLEMIIRKIIMAHMRYPQQATMKIVSATVVEVSFPKARGFDYNPGQYLYIRIPEISWYESHPFSISSSPKQPDVTLHIRIAGSWTAALHELASKKSQTKILIEGPFGNLNVDLLQSNRYKMVILVSGGIGLTPMQSICNQLLFEHNKNRRTLKKLSFLWIERDPILTQSADVIKRTNRMEERVHDAAAAEDMSGVVGDVSQSLSVEDHGHSVPIASTLLTLVPPSRESDEKLGRHYSLAVTESDLRSFRNFNTDFASSDLDDDELEESYVEPSGDIEITGVPNGWEANRGQTTRDHMKRTSKLSRKSSTNNAQSFTETSFARQSTWLKRNDDAGRIRTLQQVLDMQVYLTGKGENMEGMSQIPYVTLGRPEILEIFSRTKQEARFYGEQRIAVCACAPKRVTDLVRLACIQLSDHNVVFDYHEEGFG